MNRDALVRLRNALVAGEFFGDLPRPFELHTLTLEYSHGDLCWKALKGSLDAAKALHEAVLTGWLLDIAITADNSYVRLYATNPVRATKSIDDASPDRAWLVAILDALIQEAR